jgi:hypothetical protein
MDTVSVHWNLVAGLASPRFFEVELSSGAIYYGSLASAAPGQMSLSGLGGPPVVLSLVEIIRLTPIGSSIWRRVDGSVDVGFTFSQADLETHWTLNGNATYRSARYRLKGSLSSQLTAREDSAGLSRNTLALSANRMMRQRWFTAALGQFQQNEELDLDLRTLGAVGFGRYFSQTNQRLLAGYTGIAYTRERFAGASTASSAEAVAGGSLDFFSPANDDFTFSNDVISFYRLGGRGRVRLELQSALRYEFFKDLYWSINGFESFDSAPPEDQKQNDAGLSITLGWKF